MMNGDRGERQICFYSTKELKDRLRDIAYEQRTTMQALLERALHEFLESNSVHRLPPWWPESDMEKAYCAGLREILRSDTEISETLSAAILHLIRVQKMLPHKKTNHT